MTYTWGGDAAAEIRPRRGRHRRPHTSTRLGRLKAALGRPAVSGPAAVAPQETPPAAEHTPAVLYRWRVPGDRGTPKETPPAAPLRRRGPMWKVATCTAS